MNARPHLARAEFGRFRRPHGEAGVTLVEVVLVGLLASLVMLALTGFYINSQSNWIDGSTQAVTQREASLVIRAISDSVHAANSAEVVPGTGTLILRNSAGQETCRFWLDSTDSLIHVGRMPLTGALVDRGPIVTSRATRFELSRTALRVNVIALELKSATGRRVRVSSLAAFYNR